MLALLVQSMAFNGQVMAMPADAAMDYSQSLEAHCPSMAISDSCCPNDASHLENQSCCDGVDTCISDCNHCLSISVAGTLLDVHVWPTSRAGSGKLTTIIPSLHSLALPTELRPPIV
ncbi:hypothetical protein [Shewanella sp. NIFS-20-20]|uniref:hypothetical protein n=1 Tax=Shewanella sp. NIFS-20-20 TaxID=2853806 RepID=UPI001C468D6C|nr:hypothetical protein [Shewanella sp. NIFS-20-20]MBV7316325.1 hypothetical protein [Shewanella sp. NIFS-20-20]